MGRKLSSGIPRYVLKVLFLSIPVSHLQSFLILLNSFEVYNNHCIHRIIHWAVCNFQLFSLNEYLNWIKTLLRTKAVINVFSVTEKINKI